MIKAYINYPNPHVTTHYNLNCGNIQSHAKEDQRYIRINLTTISIELKKFRNKHYRFSATKELNDMWLEIDFNDRLFEIAVLGFICRILGTFYKPLKGVEPDLHC